MICKISYYEEIGHDCKTIVKRLDELEKCYYDYSIHRFYIKTNSCSNYKYVDCDEEIADTLLSTMSWSSYCNIKDNLIFRE